MSIIAVFTFVLCSSYYADGMATFTMPEKVGTNPQSMLWLLPLAAAIVVVYKATKLPTITAGNFLKESVTLFGSIIVFIIVSALALYTLAWLITE